MEWQPIETAPKDGTVILLGGGTWGDDLLKEAPRVMVARWDVFEYWLVCAAEGGHSVFAYDNPTHWMPLPAPPTELRT